MFRSKRRFAGAVAVLLAAGCRDQVPLPSESVPAPARASSTTQSLWTEIVDGTTEVAGIAVLEAYRHRGIAAAITAWLTREAHARGAHTAFLTPGDDGIGTVYARVGYRPAGECVHLSLVD